MKISLKWFVLLCISLTFLFTAVPDVIAGLTVYDQNNISLELSGRVQPRYQWIDNGTPDNSDVNDFYIRRTRFQFVAKYGEHISGEVEWKVDGIEQYGRDNPSAEAENAFVRFDYFDKHAVFDLGLTDGVFSREGRLSDSKNLFTEESLIQDALKEFELADNATGIHTTGKVLDGHLEYGVGIYDGIDDGEDDDLAYQLAAVYHILDVESSMEGSHIGDGNTYLTVGVYYGIQNDVTDTGISDTYDAQAYGLDIFGQFGDQSGPGTFTGSAGYFEIDEDFNSRDDADNDGFYLEGAYLLPMKVGSGKLQGDLEFALRYGEYDPEDSSTTANRDQERFSLGTNYYIIKHNVKVQATYNINDSDIESRDHDDFTIQVQLAL